jgi:hypothetical protein
MTMTMSWPVPAWVLYLGLGLALIVYSMSNSVLSVHTAMLYLGQVAVANENLFSTSLPGYIKVK